jgi:prepilin-type processing-associated H-X9-DG protein
LKNFDIVECPASSARLADERAKWFVDVTFAPEYLDSAVASDPRNGGVLAKLKGDRVDPECLTSQHYVYLPYAVATEENAVFLWDALYLEMAADIVDFMEEDIVIPGGHGPAGGNTFYRLRDGIDRFFTSDINNPGLGAVSDTDIPVLFDVMSLYGRIDPNHAVPTGGNVLYMDGHVQFRKVVETAQTLTAPPYTEVLIEWMRTNTYNNTWIENVPPWCSNRLEGTEFEPRYVYYPDDEMYTGLYI